MEKWTLLDEKGNPTGRTLTRGERLPAGQYHLVVHIWVVGPDGRLLIQRRAAHLRLMPGLWAATGGSAVAGEPSRVAARRELREELGIFAEADAFVELGRLRRRSSFCDLWLLRQGVDETTLTLQAEEVAEVKWVSWDELMAMAERREFHHYGKEYFSFLHEGIRNA